jgi:hypothetical protein
LAITAPGAATELKCPPATAPVPVNRALVRAPGGCNLPVARFGLLAPKAHIAAAYKRLRVRPRSISSHVQQSLPLPSQRQ